MNYSSFSFILAINPSSFYGKKPTVVNQQRPAIQLRFINDTDLSEDGLIVWSSVEEEVFHDVALYEPESENDQQVFSSDDEALINFANRSRGEEKAKKKQCNRLGRKRI